MSTVHSLVYAALSQDAALNALGIDADSCWAAGSFDGPQPTPFMVIRWGLVTRGIGPSNPATVTLFVYDDPGSYERTNAILLRARAVMLGLSATGTASNWITSVQWLGDSEEGNDDAYRTLMRNAEFSVVSNTL